jgi:hypothetical protein
LRTGAGTAVARFSSTQASMPSDKLAGIETTWLR